MYTAVIVDDEKAQQELLSGMLRDQFPQITLMDICSSVDEGVQKINKINPHLVFLDVVMPPKNGFDLLFELGEINFEIIFTTSFEEYAVKAFKVSAVDYLLKPFGASELKNAIEKFEKRIQSRHTINNIDVLLQNLRSKIISKTKIALPSQKGYVFVEVCDIVRCEADNTYTTFFFTDKSSLVVSKSIKECEEILSDFQFFRIHLSYLINLNYVKEYLKGDGGQVRMTDGSVIDVSRRKKEEFLKALHKI
jgi:two-component system LytT family response regulator